jgi:hypothetical protein
VPRIQERRKLFIISLTTVVWQAMLFATTVVAEPPPGSPKLGLHFTELPTSIKDFRFAFECKDVLAIEARWIAQNVGDATPVNSRIGKVKMATHGALDVAQRSRPMNGWPIGLYRLELWHNQRPLHTAH